VKNLRHSLKRRLGGGEDVGPSKRVDYRDLVRRIYYKRVDSAFEADCVYYEAARTCFPNTYSGMVGFRPAWFVHVDPNAAFPRFVKTNDLSPRPGQLIGPLEDKHAAQRLVELAEDSFNLCRYHNILVQAPHGVACAYKEMGKCPAPCDGSIAMDPYRSNVARAADAVVNPGPTLAQHTTRMRQAAGELKFELAGRIKSLIDSLAKLGTGPFRHARRLDDFAYLSLQRGPTAKAAKLFLITPGQIRMALCLRDLPAQSSDVLRYLLHAAQERLPVQTTADAERMGIVSHHLFSAKASQGVFLPLGELEEKSFAKAYKDLLKQKIADEAEEEGVMKELQAI
jgi:excinuclease UvrABC nuclease subunit